MLFRSEAHVAASGVSFDRLPVDRSAGLTLENVEALDRLLDAAGSEFSAGFENPPTAGESNANLLMGENAARDAGGDSPTPVTRCCCCCEGFATPSMPSGRSRHPTLAKGTGRTRRRRRQLRWPNEGASIQPAVG